MIDVRKLRSTLSFSNIAQNHLRLKPAENPRFQSTKRTLQSKGYEVKLPGKSIMKEAQAALLDYLHLTRSLQFLDADNICKNSPFFLHDLLKKTQKPERTENTKHSISRYLRYHPINEFEPFFESVGLKPSEYAPFLPRGMIFLNDDTLLMKNYHTLCNYGVPRTKMGKIFKQAPQVFRYENGVLSSKIKAYEDMGVAPSTLVDVIAVSPSLLVGDVNLDFVKVVERLKHLDVIANSGDWIDEHLLDVAYCNWGMMLELLCLLSNFHNEEQLADIICNHPCVVFEESGGGTLSLIAFLIKFGLSVNQIALMFLEFPQIKVDKFFANLRQCFKFLNDIKMQAKEIENIFQSHSLLLGSFTLKKTKSLLGVLHVGKKRLCRMVQDNPQEMKNWALGLKLQPLVSCLKEDEQKSKAKKKEFLLSLGYVENSEKMMQALKVFRGKGAELKERFDFIVNTGLNSEDVRRMIEVSPQILNQNTDRINMKIDYLLNEGYSVSDLVSFPSFLAYTPRRVKLRLSMYNWLKDHKAVDAGLALSTIIACSEKIFVRHYVNRHPSGFEVWKDLKKEFYPEDYI